MASAAVPIQYHDEARGEDFLIPAEAHSFAGFRRWSQSGDFPERGRIDYLAGKIDFDMSPEDAYTHGAVKTAVAAELHLLIGKTGLGTVYVDSMRVASAAAKLSAEPDVLAVLWSSLEEDRVREVQAASQAAGRIIEFEGAPDLIVEIVSDSSVHKDTKRLPPLYAAAGVPELWLIDARGDAVRFAIHQLAGHAYRSLPPDSAGWILSPLLDRRVRLTRSLTPLSRWAYELEHAPAQAIV